jgi:hypothetical protein
MNVAFGRTLLAIAMIASSMALRVPAWANGAGFFEELESDDEEVGSPFFGFAKESGGRFVADATITATIKSMNSSVAVHTDVQGHYRIPGFSKSIDPKQVEITCSKDGYKQVSTLKRPPAGGPNAPIEVDCTLAKN